MIANVPHTTRRIVTLLSAACALVGVALAPAPAAAVGISGPFHLREHAGPNDLGHPSGDRQIVGATSVTPPGDPTVVTATQAGLTLPVDFRPDMVAPAQYFINMPFDATRTGPWAITATRDAGTASAGTSAIATPALLPFVANVQVLGIGLTPTVAWELPDLSGLGVDRVRLSVFEAVSGVRQAQLLVPPRIQADGSSALPIAFTIPGGMLQYGRTYVFRVQLEDLIPGTGILQNRSSVYSSAYTAARAVAGNGFTQYADRTTFEAELAAKVLDDYGSEGYQVNPNPDIKYPNVLSDGDMSAVLGETRYTATYWPAMNLVLRYPDPADPSYCSGCNGSFRLDFTATSVGNASGVFGVGFDVEAIVRNFHLYPEHPWAFVTFGDGSTAALPLTRGFWAVTTPRRIRSIHVGLADGSATNLIYMQIDNLTIGSARAIGVTIDIKPGSFPNSVNLVSKGTVPVAILSVPDFDAAQVDPASVTLGGATAQRKRHGRIAASFEDVDGDGLADLVLHVPTDALTLSPSDTEAVLEGETFEGTPIHGVDSVRIVR